MMKIAGKSTSRPPTFFSKSQSRDTHSRAHACALFAAQFHTIWSYSLFHVFLPLFHQAVSTEFISRNTYNFFLLLQTFTEFL